jgi:hypothetical protein
MPKLSDKINDESIPTESSAPGDYVAASRDVTGTPEDVALDIGQELADKAPFSAINDDEDFYESGTFTPTYRPESGSFSSIGYSRQQGFYAKIGEYCIVSGSIATSSLTIGTASGRVEIAGLPFTASSSYIGRSAVSIAEMGRFDGVITYAGVENSTDFVRLHDNDSSQDPSDFEVASLKTGTSTFRNIFYFTVIYPIE